MKLTLRKSDSRDDWHVIEQAEHDGRLWMERIGENGAALRTSARFSDADVEGMAVEMRALAQAIRVRTNRAFKRCAVGFVGDAVDFWSPRNSTEPGRVSLADADALADEIDRVLGAGPLPKKEPADAC